MKHLWLLLLAAALATGSAWAQTPKVPKATDVTPATKAYSYVEEMPQLPGGGGNAAIAMAIAKELRSPLLMFKSNSKEVAYWSNLPLLQ